MARKVYDTGVGVGLLKGLVGTVASETERKRKDQADLLKVWETAKASAAYDPEKQVIQKVLGLQGMLEPTPQPGGSGYTAQERSLGLPEQVEEATRTRNAPVQGQMDNLLRAIGKKPEKSILERTLEAEELQAARTRGALNERGLAGESAGRLSAASSGSRLAAQSKSLLFPNGPGSFRRDLALKLQDPTGASLVNDKEAQQLEFAIGRAIDSQRLVQTGVNFRPDELKRLTRQFIANALADPDAAWLKVNELYRTLEDTRASIDPQGRWSQGNDAETFSGASGGDEDFQILGVRD